MFHDPLIVIAALLLGLGSVAAFVDAGLAYRRHRRRNYPPPPKAQLHVFDAEGGHILSANLPTTAVEKLLADYNRGRFA